MRVSCLYFTFAALLCLNFENLSSSSVSAQIIPDTTLPTNSSINNQNSTITITGGTQAGSNLFHSFEQFSNPTGNTAYFNNIGNIQNIISRVTGSSVSNIDGLLQANGTANLFLLNPNGIIFGSNARLNIGGSFIGSTATSIKFADNTEFNAKAPQDKPLLSVNVPIGLNFTGSAGSINVQNTGHTQLIDATSVASFTQVGGGPGQSPNGLRSQANKTIALIGGDVIFEGGVITAPSGWIEVGSVDSGIVNLALTSGKIAFDYTAVNSFQDIHLVKQSLLDASGEFFGDIHIQGRNITFTDGSLALIANLERLNPGAIRIDATETLDMTGITSFNIQPSLGTLKIVRGLSTITVSGKGADIIISAKNFIGQGSEVISPIAFGFGNSGDLIINSTDSVEILGSAANETSGIGSVFGTVTYGNGEAGDVTLSTKRLRLDKGGTLESLTFGKGGAGEVIVSASEFLKISGGQAYDLILQRTSDGLPDVANAIPAFLPSSILSQSLSSGNAGDIKVSTSQLTIENGGRLTASALVSGASSNITINASDAIDVIGSGSVNQSLNASTITSSVGTVDPYLNFIYNIRQAPTGSTGSVKINTGSLNLRNGGQVSVRNDGVGKAGDVEINANSIKLDNQAGITASSQSGQGGNIEINSDDLLLLRHNSQITTSAGNARSAGDGGQINISTNFIIAPSSENNDITANAFEGRGGNIKITAQGIFGIESRPRLTPLSDITASSALGINGTVQINTLNTNPINGLVSLPPTVVDSSRLVAQDCSAREDSLARGRSKFIISGRGGVPPQPGDPLRAEATVFGQDTLKAGEENHLGKIMVVLPTRSTSTRIVEAQGWIINNQGQVVLTAQPPNVTPYSSRSTQVTCYAP